MIIKFFNRLMELVFVLILHRELNGLAACIRSQIYMRRTATLHLFDSGEPVTLGDRRRWISLPLFQTLLSSQLICFGNASGMRNQRLSDIVDPVMGFSLVS